MLLLALILLLVLPVEAQEPTEPVIYFYRDGQAVPVGRPGVSTESRKARAQQLLLALVEGPEPEEIASGLSSPLPSGSELLAVAISGEQAMVDLRVAIGSQTRLDAYRSDAIVEQIVKTLHPLDLHHIQVRVLSDKGEFVPLSDLLPAPPAIAPTTPTNDEELPDRFGSGPDRTGTEPEHMGQPPVTGQGQPQGPLSGKSVWLSAGHGWYWSTTLSSWRSQRPNTYGIVEDFANAEAVNYYLARYLWNAGADVWLVRERAMTEHEVIVDNDDGAPGYTETGVWTTSSTPGYIGGAYRWANTFDDAPTATATWTPNLPEAGRYAVWAWYREGANRTADARFEIHHAGGVTTSSISQEVHGRTWRYLGEFFFEAGAVGYVTLTNNSDDPGQVVVADAIRFGGGVGSISEPGGTSGEPRWEEGSKYWVQYQLEGTDAPPEIYDNDVTARPLYAEWESAKGYPGEAENAVYISWHTNAGGGYGTESYIHSTEPTTGSAELQDWVHAELIGDLRAGWNPAWRDRGQKSADFGELRELLVIPGILLEVAFHDSEDPGDADDLREPLFRQIAARAVYQGIVKYHADRSGSDVHLLPEPPTHLSARNAGPGEVLLGWRPPPCCDGLVGDAATSYKVYHSHGGRGFDNGTVVNDPLFVFSGLPPGTLHFFRVTALNQGGESFPSPVVAVRTPGPGGSASFLIVDGFDRLDEKALIPQWESSALGTAQRMFLERMNRYDYAVEHGQALAGCNLAFDGAVNEAVEAGDVELEDYQAVDWFVGEDSVADASLSDIERSLLTAYLDGGGSLLLSGSEIGYDLVEYGRDASFFRDYLRAEYRGDNAGTHSFAGAAAGIFEGLGGSFDDSTQGTYDVGYPDRLGSAAGSNVSLQYIGGTGDGAAVTYAGDSALAYFGFPLETVTDAATRNDLLCAAAYYLLPSPVAGVVLEPDDNRSAQPGQTITYTHTLTNTGQNPDTFDVAHHSSQGWTVTYPPSLTLEAGLTATLWVSIAVPLEAVSGTTDITLITATSRSEPTVSDSVTNRTTVIDTNREKLGIPRLINPGFELGLGQSAWQRYSSDANPIIHHVGSLPAYVEPFHGEWLAWLGGYAPGIMATATLTQVVALPSGEPTVTLELAWFAHAGTMPPAADDVLSASIYDLSGTLHTQLLTVTPALAVDDWQTQTFELDAYAGQTIQLAFRAASKDTSFFVDDVNLSTSGPAGPDEFRALWVDAYHEGIKSPQQIDELVETAQAGSFNALVAQVRRRADTYYPSALDPWAPDAMPGFNALAYLIQRAHAAGIEVHAWATTLAIWGGDTPPAAPDHIYHRHGPGAEGRDYWLMTSYGGEEKASDVYYLDPGHPDAVDYTVASYAELATNYDLDGIHLDRVRYGWQDFGYNPTAVARFQAQMGRDDLPGPTDTQWLQWRRDQLTALVRKIYLTVTAINPRLRLSAALSAAGGAPSASYPWETRTPYTHQLQDWRSWLEEGIIDLGISMTYKNEESYAYQFDDWIAWEKDHQYDRAATVGTGLYLNTVEDSMAQWLRVRQPSGLGNQALGICGYSYATPSNEVASRREFVNAAVTAVYTQTASLPILDWKANPTLGHLAGMLSAVPPCASPVDSYPLTLSGPDPRSLVTDGGGWFGAVDLEPGDYVLSVQVPSTGETINHPVTILPGAIAEANIALRPCHIRDVYLPLIVRGTDR